MRRIYEIGVLVLLLLTMMSCRQRDIMAEAEQQTAALRDALERDVPMDSIRAIAEQREDICFYIFLYKLCQIINIPYIKTICF